jgi:broad specificity phosphatase PhoE
MPQREGTAMATISDVKISREPVIMLSPEQLVSLLRAGRKPVFLVRHGQTDWNCEKRLQGREDIPLNSSGVAQSKQCAEVFRRAADAGLVIDTVYSSPLVRSMETARIISEEIGARSPRLENMLVERDYGELSGLTLEERRCDIKEGRQASGAESKYHAGKRMKRAVASIAARTQSSAVAVTHGGVLGALFSVITSGRVGTGKNLSDNCGVSIVASGKHDVIPVAFNIGGDQVLRYAEAISNT